MAGEPGDIGPAAGEQAVENDVPVSDADSDQAMAGRRLSIAARLVRLGFITEDRATPDNPAVQVLSELLPPDAELGLCLTCHGFSSSAPYPFAETTGIFPNVGSFRMNPALAQVSPHGPPLLTAPRSELVVCTQVALSWTASRVRSDRQDVVNRQGATGLFVVGVSAADYCACAACVDVRLQRVGPASGATRKDSVVPVFDPHLDNTFAAVAHPRWRRQSRQMEPSTT